MKTRQSYEPAFKKEIAEGYYTRKLTPKDIEAKGIRMNNVHRWVHQFFGRGGRAKEGEPAPETATPEAEPTPATLDIHTLSRRKIKRGANGRYPDKVKDMVMSALLQKSVPEVSEITGIHNATLYLWRDAAQKQQRANGGGALVVANEKPRAVPANGEARSAEVIINPASTEAILANIRKGEGFANLDKAVKQLKSAHRSGQIEDYDEIDLRFLLGFRLLTGAPLRARK